MWHYFWAHLVYHFTRLCPKHRTRKCPLVILLILLTVTTLAPQLYVVFFRLFYITFCPYPLHSLMVGSIFFTFIMIAFSFLFAVMDPVEKAIKFAFHLFGVADLAYQTVFLGYTLAGLDCLQESFITAVYVIYLTMSAGSLVSIMYFLLLSPVWVTHALLSRRRPTDKTDAEPYSNLCIKICPCVWHI